MSRAKLAIIGGIIIVIGVLLNSGLFTVRETDQVLVLQLGEHKRTVREPGRHFKIPLIQNVVNYDKRVLSVDPPAEEMLLSDQKRILVDAFARYKITDPLKFFQTVGDEQRFGNRFGNILTSTVKEFVAQRELADLLSDQRNVIMESIRDGVANETDGFGVEVVDIRIGRSELPEAVSQTVYERMRTERERQSNKLRAEGEENARRIRAEADRQQVEIVAEAQREAVALYERLVRAEPRTRSSSSSSVRLKPTRRRSPRRGPRWSCRRTAISSSISAACKAAAIRSRAARDDRTQWDNSCFGAVFC